MELALTVDGYNVSISSGSGSVILYIRDPGNCDAVEVALTPKQAAAIGLGFLAASEELVECL
jgi:hypothetical protein